MTNDKRENISAMMDGELDKGSFTPLIGDDECRATWHRYHLISDIMHQRTPVNNHPLLSRKISDSIRQEPAILAPMGRTIPGFIRPIAGLAIAASVAAVAILGIQAYRPGELSPSAEIAQGQPVRIERSNLEFGVPVSVPDRQVVQPVQLKIQSDARISRYILNHNEYQSRVGAQGVTPVSIFIEKVSTGEPVNSGSLNQDGVNVYSSSSGGIQVTAVGQVSDPTVKQIVESVLSTR